DVQPHDRRVDGGRPEPGGADVLAVLAQAADVARAVNCEGTGGLGDNRPKSQVPSPKSQVPSPKSQVPTSPNPKSPRPQVPSRPLPKSPSPQPPHHSAPRFQRRVGVARYIAPSGARVRARTASTSVNTTRSVLIGWALSNRTRSSTPASADPINRSPSR